MGKRVLCIIVTYNAMQWIDRCLNSLSKSDYPVDVFIADNGSTDDTIVHVKELFPTCHLICNVKNVGFGKANNLGLLYALQNNYDYAYLLNQDAWIFPDTVSKLIEIHSRYIEFGILSPFQMEANMERIDENFLKGVCSWTANKDLFNDYYNQTIQEIYSVPDVMAAHWLISRECLMKVGLFSPSFPHYGEDNNYAERVLYHNYKIGIVPAVRVVHDRENRIATKDKLIYLEYIRNIKILSSLNTQSCRFRKVFYNTFKALIKYRSIKTLQYFFLLIINLKEILFNRKATMREGAFLS